MITSFKHPKVFSFKYFNGEDVTTEINDLNSKKATPKADIPVKIPKWNSDIIALNIISFKYQYQVSVTNIKDIMKLKNISSFSFQPVLIGKDKDLIKSYNTKKICLDGDIPVKLIKMNEDIF